MTELSTESDRRRFLKAIAKLFFLGLSVLAGVVYLLFAYPAKIRKKKPSMSMPVMRMNCRFGGFGNIISNSP